MLAHRIFKVKRNPNRRIFYVDLLTYKAKQDEMMADIIHLIGEKLTDEVLIAIKLRIAGCAIRIVNHDSVMTMNYVSNRLNIGVSKDNEIQTFSWG